MTARPRQGSFLYLGSLFNRIATDTGSQNSEEVKATHPPSELNGLTIEEPNIKGQLLMVIATW